MNLKHVTIDGIRIHLNVGEDTLLINGYYTLHLNKTAKTELECFIDACKEFESKGSAAILSATLDKIRARYPSLSRTDADRDLQKLIETINYFAKGQIPWHLVGLDKFDDGKAPQRMDLALTYRCNNRCGHCYLKENKSAAELTTDQWKQVIDRLWAVGIPQVAFTGGECTAVPDLPALVMHAREMITGVITNGTNLTYPQALQLKLAELDWIQITLESPFKEVHDEMQGRAGAYEQTVEGIENAVKAGLSVSINATLTQKNYRDLPELIRFAHDKGVKFVATNALINSGRGIGAKTTDAIPENELGAILTNAREVAKREGVEFNWFLPTCYKEFDPVAAGFGQRCCSACGVNMLVEPDGSVIPCQSWTDLKLGNILKDDWPAIWYNMAAIKVRQHGHSPDTCVDCDYFETCGGGCPLNHINGKGATG